jgi:hypothetical protein
MTIINIINVDDHVIAGTVIVIGTYADTANALLYINNFLIFYNIYYNIYYNVKF